MADLEPQRLPIAEILHEALIAAGPVEDQECRWAYYAVLDVSTRLCVLFENEPGFDKKRFMSTVMDDTTT